MTRLLRRLREWWSGRHMSLYDRWRDSGVGFGK